jgi:flagellar basal body rod protein FlgG
MNSGYYAATTGLLSRTQALDTIANNLANVSTAGFRANHNVFSSMLVTTGLSPLSVLNQDMNDYGVLERHAVGYYARCSGTRPETSSISPSRDKGTLK